MLKAPSSAPFSSILGGDGMRVSARRAAGVMSPAQTVALFDTDFGDSP